MKYYDIYRQSDMWKKSYNKGGKGRKRKRGDVLRGAHDTKDRRHSVASMFKKMSEVKQSSIPGAGLGVFATRRIPAETNIGWYVGALATVKQAESSDFQSQYAVTLAHRPTWITLKQWKLGKRVVYEDRNATSELPCRLMRINGVKSMDDARYSVAILGNGQFETVRDIQKGEELFTYYGTDVDVFIEDNRETPDETTEEQKEVKQENTEEHEGKEQKPEREVIVDSDDDDEISGTSDDEDDVAEYERLSPLDRLRAPLDMLRAPHMGWKVPKKRHAEYLRSLEESYKHIKKTEFHHPE